MIKINTQSLKLNGMFSRVVVLKSHRGFGMDKKDLQPKQKAPVVRPTTITPPQLSEEQLTGGIMAGGQGIYASHTIEPMCWGCGCNICSFDGDDAD